MTPTPNQSNASQPRWTCGRPSFKAYYPEVILLILVTIAFVALGVKCSCGVVRSNDADKPKEIEAAYENAYFAPLAFAQDGSIDLVLPDESVEAPVADAAEPVAEAPAADAAEPVAEAPAADVAEPVAEAPAADAAEPVAEAPAADAAEPVAEASAADAAEPVAEAPAADAEPAAAPAASAPSKKLSSMSVKTKLVLIWTLCLIVPLALWIWRGWYWIVNVYGVYYELRSDPDNPKATTFLITRGIFNKKTDSLHIGQITDVSNRQSFLQKYLMGGVGTIVLYTKDVTDPEIFMKDMATPGRVFDSIDYLRSHYWGRGGMHLNDGVTNEVDAAPDAN